MNGTIEKMVEMLFDGIEETEEVLALRDEVRLNCEEHFADLIGRGMSEEDALRKVADSLSGMEEVLNAYPKKKTHLIKTCRFETEGAAQLSVYTKCEDISIEPSRDGKFNMHYNGLNRNIDARREGDILVVQLVPIIDNTISAENQKRVIYKDGMDVWHFDFDALKDKIIGGVKQAVEDAQDGGTLTISVPEEQFRMIQCHSTSGDIDALPCGAQDLVLSSTNGDIHFEGPASTVNAATTNGDIELVGDIDVVKASSTNGDLTVDGVLTSVSAGTVNGDIDVDTRSRKLMNAELHTTSGDIEFNGRDDLPLAVNAKTVSGDVKVSRACDHTADARLTASTVSGDIEIR